MQDDIKALFDAIASKAEAQKAEIAAQADKDIAEIEQRADEEVKRMRSEAISQLEGRLRTESDAIIGAAKLEMRNRRIALLNEAIDRVFASAVRKIEAMTESDGYKDILRRLLQGALRFAGNDCARLRVAEVDKPLWKTLQADLDDSIPVDFCDAPRGTIIVETSDRSQWIDNSLDARLARARQIMRDELGQILFAKDDIGADTR